MRRNPPEVLIPSKHNEQAFHLGIQSRTIDDIYSALYPKKQHFTSINGHETTLDQFRKEYAQDKPLEEVLRILGAPHLSSVHISALNSKIFIIEVEAPLKIEKRSCKLKLRLDLPKSRSEDTHVHLHSIAIRRENGHEVTGHGIGTRLFTQMVIGLSQLGLRYISCNAKRNRGSNGYYSWPRLGFNSVCDEVLKPLRKEGLLSAEGSRIESLQDVMKTPEGLTLWRSCGYTCPVVFDLSYRSESKKVLHSYLRSKRIGSDHQELLMK